MAPTLAWFAAEPLAYMQQDHAPSAALGQGAYNARLRNSAMGFGDQDVLFAGSKVCMVGLAPANDMPKLTASW